MGYGVHPLGIPANYIVSEYKLHRTVGIDKGRIKRHYFLAW